MTNEIENKDEKIASLERELKGAKFSFGTMAGFSYVLLLGCMLLPGVSYHEGREAVREKALLGAQRALYEPIGNGGAIGAWYGHEPSTGRKEMLGRLERVQSAIIEDTNFWNQ